MGDGLRGPPLGSKILVMGRWRWARVEMASPPSGRPARREKNPPPSNLVWRTSSSITREQEAPPAFRRSRLEGAATRQAAPISVSGEVGVRATPTFPLAHLPMELEVAGVAIQPAGPVREVSNPSTLPKASRQVPSFGHGGHGGKASLPTILEALHDDQEKESGDSMAVGLGPASGLAPATTRQVKGSSANLVGPATELAPDSSEWQVVQKRKKKYGDKLKKEKRGWGAAIMPPPSKINYGKEAETSLPPPDKLKQGREAAKAKPPPEMIEKGREAAKAKPPPAIPQKKGREAVKAKPPPLTRVIEGREDEKIIPPPHPHTKTVMLPSLDNQGKEGKSNTREVGSTRQTYASVTQSPPRSPPRGDRERQLMYDHYHVKSRARLCLKRCRDRRGRWRHGRRKCIRDVGHNPVYR